MVWNKCLKKVKDIKKEYNKYIGGDELNLELWVDELAKKQLGNYKENIEFIKPLHFSYKGEYVLIRYGLVDMKRGMWEDPESVYRHCRSIVIDLKNEEIVLFPFTKFFNVNEVEETRIENILKKLENAKVVEMANKLDGSLYSARNYKGEIVTSTSSSLKESKSWRLVDANRMLKINKNIVKMIKVNPEYTFVFEYISQRDSHVVIYKEEGIYLIGITDIRDGKELHYKEIKEIAEIYGVESVGIDKIGFKEMLNKSKTIKAHEKEGWVINIDGERFKVKGDEYVKLHRILDSISSVNVIIEAIADGKYDDLISKVPDAYRDRVENIANRIYEWVDKKERDIETLYFYRPKGDIKRFMLWTELLDKKYRPYLKCKYLGEEYNLLKNYSGSYVTCKDIFGVNSNEV